MFPKRKVYWRKYCCVKSCLNNSSLPRISFFKFPRDPERCAIWLKNCQRLDLAKFSSEHLSVNYKVCSAHFDSEMFAGLSGSKLKKNAIPKPILDDEEYKPETQPLMNMNFELENCHANETNNIREFAVKKFDAPLGENPQILKLKLSLPSPTNTTNDVKSVQPKRSCYLILCKGVAKREPPTETDTANKSNERKFGAQLEVSSLMKPFDLSSPSDNTILSYNRAISVTKTNSAVVEMLENISKGQINLFKSDLARGMPSKRIIFLYDDDDLKKIKQCPLCNERFRTCMLFEDHLLSKHKDYYPFKCENCGEEFKKAVLYNEHLNNYELYQECGIRKCYICKMLISKSLFKSHFSLHKTVRCNLCTRTFLTEMHLDRHLSRHQIRAKTKRKPEESFLCSICGKLLKGSSSMRYHLNTHSEDRNFLCDECPKAFKSNSVLQKHKELMHSVQQTYKCSLCDTKVKNKGGLRSHMKLKHSNRSLHKCVMCGMEFLRLDYYRRHVRRHMGVVGNRKYRYIKKEGDDADFQCKYCQRKYPNVYVLRVHLLKSHLKVRTRCRFCDMTFGDDSSRIRHEKRHRDPKKFELTCKVCWSCFGSKERLEKHLEKHKNSQRRKCDECGETFPSKYLLTHHKTEQHFNKDLEAQRRDALLEDGLSEFTIH